jgi:hypothetical protein
LRVRRSARAPFCARAVLRVRRSARVRVRRSARVRVRAGMGLCDVPSHFIFRGGSGPVLPVFGPVGFRPGPRPRTSDDNLQGIYLLRFDFLFSNSIKSNPFTTLFTTYSYLFYYSFIILPKFDLI